MSVHVERRDGVQVITIDRPEARNALDRAVAEAVAAAVDELDRDDDLRVGVLTGGGGTFSSGMDLKAFLRGETPAIEGRGLCGITETPPAKPLIAAVEGWALAGDHEVKRGLVAAGGAALLLPRRVGPAAALEMLLTGDPVEAPRAAEIGLVNRVVDDGAALDGALALAATVAANGPLAVRVSKHLARSAADWSFAQGWREQEPLVMPVFLSEDAQEGAAAFAEKRPPAWKGR
jgi:enoyl-CoA hydratase